VTSFSLSRSKGIDKKQITEKIGDLKKEIKSLTAKLKYLYNPTKKNQKLVQQDSSIQQQRKLPLPKGAKNADEGIHILDLQIIDLKKQNDLFHAKMQKRQENLDKLSAEYQKLHTYKKEKTSLIQSERPPETQEEDHNRKVRDTGWCACLCFTLFISSGLFILTLSLTFHLHASVRAQTFFKCRFTIMREGGPRVN
jgi:FtsZ-binding cell division protein ZapB